MHVCMFVCMRECVWVPACVCLCVKLSLDRDILVLREGRKSHFMAKAVSLRDPRAWWAQLSRGGARSLLCKMGVTAAPAPQDVGAP